MYSLWKYCEYLYLLLLQNYFIFYWQRYTYKLYYSSSEKSIISRKIVYKLYYFSEQSILSKKITYKLYYFTGKSRYFLGKKKNIYIYIYILFENLNGHIWNQRMISFTRTARGQIMITFSK